MRARTARLARIVTVVTVVSALAGGAVARSFAPGGGNIVHGALIGGLNGGGLGLIEIALRGGALRLRPMPVVALLALKTAIYGAVFIASVGVSSALVHLVAPGMPMPGMAMLRPGVIALAFAVAFGLNFLFVLRTILGPRTLAALVTGRYQQPRSEERIVMFLDLLGSTPLAERLGDVAFHRFLNRVFFDITDPVLEAGGEIYRYVGDEIIITWVAAKRVASAAAIECLFAIGGCARGQARRLRRGVRRGAAAARRASTRAR